MCFKNYIECGTRTYPSADNTTCLPCHSSCDQCKGSFETDCTSCEKDLRARYRFLYNGKCELMCPKDYYYEYSNYTCLQMDEMVYYTKWQNVVVLGVFLACAICCLVTLPLTKTKPEARMTLYSFYALTTFSECVARVLLFVALFLEVRYTPTMAVSLSLLFFANPCFWNYKYFHFDPLTRMRSFENYYSNHKVSLIIVQIISAIVGPNFMLVIASGLLKIPAFSQNLNAHPIFRVFHYKSSWTSGVGNLLQAILCGVNLYLYSYKSVVFSLSILSCAQSLALIGFYIAETFLIKSVRKNLELLTMKASIREEAKMDAEAQKIKLIKSGQLQE